MLSPNLETWNNTPPPNGNHGQLLLVIRRGHSALLIPACRCDSGTLLWHTGNISNGDDVVVPESPYVGGLRRFGLGQGDAWFRNGSRRSRLPIYEVQPAAGLRRCFWALTRSGRRAFWQPHQGKPQSHGVTKSSEHSSIVPGVSTLARSSEGCCGVMEPDLLAALDGYVQWTLHARKTEARCVLRCPQQTLKCSD